ncbi:unnamed protein product [Parnassius mnemosyne]|uniref:RNA-directed DNA polymerase n=1 Tax=Parnassius mnemosyne TaxID=213953 RepID=A0AAV1L2E5_9NEOP
MKERFYSTLASLRTITNAKNTAYIEDERYKKLIEEVSTAKITARKTSRDYWLLRRYDVLTIDQKSKLIFPVKDTTSTIIYYACDRELFDILHEAHIQIGHGGRDRMMKEVGSHYKNITRKDIETYLELCEPCQQKQKNIKKGIVVKPNISSEFNSRCQVDLIDFQSQPDGDNKFIMVYQDHLTKFVVLKPLKTKRAEEVAHTLLDIFTLLGAPAILQSDNGREFSNRIIENLKTYWPTLKIIHGKPRHSQSQGSVERANQDIENMLTTWMQDNNNSHWSEGLRFVQLMKNRAFHAGIKQSLYEALFGCKVKVGLQLPNDFTQNVETEEDLEKIIQDLTKKEENPEVTACEFSKLAPTNAAFVHKKLQRLTHVENVDVQSTLFALLLKNHLMKDLDLKFCVYYVQRNISAKKNLQQQAEKMLKSSEKKFAPVPIGTSVRIAVPEVDRGRGDVRNIKGVVLAKTDDELYQIGTKNGILKQVYSRFQINVCPRALLDAEDVPSTEIALRCLCYKNKLLCTSKCHSGLPCKNK